MKEKPIWYMYRGQRREFKAFTEVNDNGKKMVRCTDCGLLFPNLYAARIHHGQEHPHPTTVIRRARKAEASGQKAAPKLTPVPKTAALADRPETPPAIQRGAPLPALDSERFDEALQFVSGLLAAITAARQETLAENRQLKDQIDSIRKALSDAD